MLFNSKNLSYPVFVSSHIISYLHHVIFMLSTYIRKSTFGS